MTRLPVKLFLSIKDCFLPLFQVVIKTCFKVSHSGASEPVCRGGGAASPHVEPSHQSVAPSPHKGAHLHN